MISKDEIKCFLFESVEVYPTCISIVSSSDEIITHSLTISVDGSITSIGSYSSIQFDEIIRIRELFLDRICN